MKQRMLAGVVLVVAGLAAACNRPAASPSPSPTPPATPTPTPKPLPSPLPDTVAIVNGHPIAGQMLEKLSEAQISARNVPKEYWAFVYRSTLNDLVARELLYQEAEARGIKAKAQDVETLYDRQRAKAPSEAAWRSNLRQQGFTPQQYRLEVRVNRMVQLLIEQIQAGILPESVTDADARAYYDAHPSEFETPERLRVSHILIAVPQNASPQAREAQRAKAQEILDLLKKGGDFATLARQRSNDTSTAANGGKLPDFAKGTFAPPFESAAFALQPGALSGLVETAYGYHIIKLHERVPARKAPYEEVAQRLKAFLVQQKRVDATNRLVEQLRAKAKIEILI